MSTITEDHLDQLALTGFLDSGWNSHCPGFAPDGDESALDKLLGAMKAGEK